MYTYSIIPLKEDHFEERLLDVKEQYNNGITTLPLFMMFLVPEGDPVFNKVDKQCELYARYRDRLMEEGIPSGVLIQSTFGHNNSTTLPAKFQKMVQLNGDVYEGAYCPMDADTLDYLCDAIKKIANENPKAIMVDDDVRIIMRPGHCCACPLHMNEFNRRNKTDFTREELYSHIMSHPDDDKIAVSYTELQRDTLVHAVTRFREAIDEVDETIQGINCTSGDECDSVIYTNPIFAGKNNPTIVRAPNGTYAPENVRGFSDIMRRAAVCGSRLKDNGIEIVLAETDTVPYNRYAKSANYLHAQYTASILEGLKGAKHWLTRSLSYEKESGLAYREILSKHRYFYEKIAALSDELTFFGANSYFIEQKRHSFHNKTIWEYHSNTWAAKLFERIGLPFYFSNKKHGADFLESNIVEDMTDEQIAEIFSGSVFLTSEVARSLVNRGYIDLVGVDIKDYDGPVSCESLDETGSICCTKQEELKQLCPINDKVKILSYNILKDRNGIKLLSPAVTKYEREDGNITVVFCGTPDVEFRYDVGFSFLNATRKAQLISLLKEAGTLPIYCETDNELCLRAGKLADGRILAAIFNLSYDQEETINLYLEKQPEEVTLIDTDGEEMVISWVSLGNDIYSLEVSALPLYPIVLLIK